MLGFDVVELHASHGYLYGAIIRTTQKLIQLLVLGFTLSSRRWQINELITTVALCESKGLAYYPSLHLIADRIACASF